MATDFANQTRVEYVLFGTLWGRAFRDASQRIQCSETSIFAEAPLEAEYVMLNIFKWMQLTREKQQAIDDTIENGRMGDNGFDWANLSCLVMENKGNERLDTMTAEVTCVCPDDTNYLHSSNHCIARGKSLLTFDCMRGDAHTHYIDKNPSIMQKKINWEQRQIKHGNITKLD